LAGHDNAITTLVFSPDGRWLATGSLDETARLWDLSAADPGANPRVLRGHTDGVDALAFSTDGRWLATGSSDSNIQLWELTAGEPATTPLVLHGHTAAVFTLAFSPDGHWLASGSMDRTTRLWNMRLDELVALACQDAGRNFSQEEWQRYFPGQDYRRTCAQWPEGR
jgi:WD40 repeat protein